MFDWNDEELANIVWGEAGESDDHIVPYPESSEDLHNKKEWNQDASAVKLIEQKGIEAKTDFHGRKLGSSSKLDNSAGKSNSGYGTNSWPDLSLSSTAKTDQSSLGTEVSKTSEETINLKKDVEIFPSTREDEEQGDFVDYAWDNIGSFDDLDRIFRNDDPIFGHVSLENSDELWSSKDVNNSPVPILSEAQSLASALRNRSEPLEIKTKYDHHTDRSFSASFKRIGHSASHDKQNAHVTTGNAGYARGRSIRTEKEQQDMVGMTTSVPSAEDVGTENELTDKGKQEGKVLQNFYGNWSPSGQFGNKLAPSAMQSSPSSILGQQKQIQAQETLYQNLTNTYAESTMSGNLANTYPGMSMLPQAQSGLRHQPLLSGYGVSPGVVNHAKKYMDSIKPLTMTPQEKIEKLRRRQQMQAMLAIQKQQQQLGHQVLSTNKPMTKKCDREMQGHLCAGADPEIEDLRTLYALDSPTECDDSNTTSAAIDDHFVEDTMLYMLQDTISKLDVKIRLCIRDSLFRLAQSAMQRQSVSDSSRTNKTSREKLEVVTREESDSQTRHSRVADVEAETNPIDRTVAHLLFHRPLELTGNYSDKLDSPITSKMRCESKAANLENFPTGCLPDEDLKSKQFSHEVLKNSSSLFEAQPMDEFKNSHCIDTSENASNNEPADVGDKELEASQ